jgi:hypothetical protein
MKVEYLLMKKRSDEFCGTEDQFKWAAPGPLA